MFLVKERWWAFSLLFVGLHEVIAEHVILNFLAADVGEHDAIDFHAGKSGCLRLSTISA